MSDFLLELRSEEVPARMQDDARQNLKRLFEAELAKAGLKADDIITYATPRRLTLIARALPLETQAVSEETKGPKVGAPPQALEGFLRKTGLTQAQLTTRNGVYFAVVEKAGRKTADVLVEAIPAIIRAFPWPKSMRWGAASISTESLRWVRPLQGIIALLGNEIVPCAIDGIVSGRETVGHRFHHQGAVSIDSADDYAEKLRAAYVIVDQNERELIVRDGAQAAAAAADLVLVQDPFLVTENAGLTEWPVPLLGRFDPAFLSVPEEVIQLTARVNQKYFICRDHSGKLANAFVCTANIVAHDGGAAIVAGNEKVLAARLSDAKFFFEQDVKVLLEAQASKLSNIVFHEKLGTVADKVERVAKLARWLVESGVIGDPPRSRGGEPRSGGGGAERDTLSDTPLHHPSDGPRLVGRLAPGNPPDDALSGEDLAALAERAARLCKADLVTGMVGEFPELQGIMGSYYARAQGESDAVADAIRDHYKPVGQGDDVPTAPVTVAVSLADKLDTLLAFAAINEMPTGSKDPFALRRAAISVMRVLIVNNVRLSIVTALKVVAVNLAYSRAKFMLTFQNESLRGLADDWLDAQMSGRPMQATENGSVFQEKIGGGKTYFAKDLETVLVAIIDYHQNAAGQVEKLLVLFADRLKVQQREAGVRHDLIDAVFALGGEDDLVRLLARVKALQAFVTTDEGINLLAAYKRAANILKSSPGRGGGARGASDGGGGQEAPLSDAPLHHPSGGPPPLAGEDHALETALAAAEPLATAAIEAEDFEAAMTALASLRVPIDAFFEGVMVNDPDPLVRAYRLGLLTRFRDAVHKVADFSKIEG